MTQQVFAVLGAFALKPAHMILSLVILWMLRKPSGPDLRQLRAGVAIFFAGELFCAINFLFVDGMSMVLDWVHSLGMVLGFGFIFLGLFTLLDVRVFFITGKDKRCAFARFCSGCFKDSEASCGLERFFIFIAAALIALSLLPLARPIIHIERTVIIFGGEVSQYYPEFLQIIFLRIYPFAGMALLIASLFILLLKKRSSVSSAKYPFSIGLGFFTYSLLKFILLYCFEHRTVWADFWEEATELIVASGIFVLLLVFNKQLIKNRAES
ncbi:MAG: hypothetical protein ABIJ56_11790 [Pseudomonadota bacterium]